MGLFSSIVRDIGFPGPSRRIPGRRIPAWGLVLVALAYFALEYAPRLLNRDAEIERAIAARASGEWVTTDGVVEKPLPDDADGDRHQRFLLKLPSRRVVLVAHNIDVAKRVPAAAGDAVTVRGRFEWNDRGGVVHWTHRDSSGRRAGGWILHDGHRYE